MLFKWKADQSMVITFYSLFVFKKEMLSGKPGFREWLRGRSFAWKDVPRRFFSAEPTRSGLGIGLVCGLRVSLLTGGTGLAGERRLQCSPMAFTSFRNVLLSEQAVQMGLPDKILRRLLLQGNSSITVPPLELPELPSGVSPCAPTFLPQGHA